LHEAQLEARHEEQFEEEDGPPSPDDETANVENFLSVRPPPHSGQRTVRSSEELLKSSSNSASQA
jgi:hypothetical protein